MKFEELRNTYKEFIYDSFDIVEDNVSINITYHFEIPNLTTFEPKIVIPKKIIKNEINDFAKKLIFHIGLVELISYYKCVCPKNVIIKAGYINEEQINWFKKLYFYAVSKYKEQNLKTSINENTINKGIWLEFKSKINDYKNFIEKISANQKL